MRVLDIDLDFFLNDIAIFRSDYGKRLNEYEYFPWSEKDVIYFLENQCGLSTNNKVKGRIIVHHHEAFLFWRELIQKGMLQTPFDVTHIDAHADLGLGDASWVYIMQNLLYRPLDKRIYPDKFRYRWKYYKFTFTNYLAFAIGCRWINSLQFVTHPKWENDLPNMIFKEFTEESGIIQLKKYDKKINLGQYDSEDLKSIKPLSIEPEVPFFLVPSEEFTNNEKISFVNICQSPGYTPKTADKLIDLISKYIDLI